MYTQKPQVVKVESAYINQYCSSFPFPVTVIVEQKDKHTIFMVAKGIPKGDGEGRDRE